MEGTRKVQGRYKEGTRKEKRRKKNKRGRKEERKRGVERKRDGERGDRDRQVEVLKEIEEEIGKEEKASGSPSSRHH